MEAGQTQAGQTEAGGVSRLLWWFVDGIERLGRVAGLALTAVGQAVLLPVALASSWVWQRLRLSGVAQGLRRRVGPLAVSRGGSGPDGPSAPGSGTGGDPPDPPTGFLTASTGPLPVAPEPELPARSLGATALWAGAWLLAVGAWALMTTLNRIDSALQQMGTGARSTLSFPLEFGQVAASQGRPAESAAGRTVALTRSAWDTFVQDTLPFDRAGARVLRDPHDIANTLFWLDLAFVALYGLLLFVGIIALMRVNHRRTPLPGESPQPRRRRHLALFRATGALVLLVVVDVLEDLALRAAYVSGDQPWSVGGLAVGPLLSAAKLLLVLAVLAPVLVVGVVLGARDRALRRAVVSVRGVLYGLALLFALLMVGIGADQMDDVIRAWDPGRAVAAAAASMLLGVSVAGVIRRFTSDALDRPDPATGYDPQRLFLGGGIVLVVVGQLLRWAGLGWGVTVPGVLLIAIWAAGVPFDGAPAWPRIPAAGGRQWWPRVAAALVGAAAGVAVTAMLGGPVLPGGLLGLLLGLSVLAWLLLRGVPLARVRGVADPDRADRDRAELDSDVVLADDIAVWGDRIGRLAGSSVAALLVVAIARAVALDRFVDRDPNGDILRSALVGALLSGAGGAILFARRSRRVVGNRSRWWWSAWMVSLVLSFAVGLALRVDRWAVDLAQSLGTIVIVFGAFALGLGLLAAAASAIRQGPVGHFQLAPALRGLRLRRFPVVAFVAVWVVVVANVDQGGFHDIRRGDAGPAETTTVNQALDSYLTSDSSRPPGTARPVVLVGASGGGIRAAVWTALVMECVFGPGGVEGSPDGVCAHDAAAVPVEDTAGLRAEAARPTPVFLASGASGGSVGLAAWSARRGDLVDTPDPATSPGGVNQMLTGDLVAPLVGRLAVLDLPNALLAAPGEDRAALLEKAWEAAYAASTPGGAVTAGKGLRRGLRDLWDVSHRGGAWSTPVLALNGTQVEDGCRFLSSAVDFRVPSGVAGTATTQDRPDDASCRGPRDPRDYQGIDLDIVPSTNELIDYLCPGEDVPLSTAAHLSARFPYASPTGRVARSGCAGPGLVPGPAVSYVADGGLFDNSGAGTAVDAWRALAPYANAWQARSDATRQAAVPEADRRRSCLVPIFVQVDNSPPTDTVADITSPDRRPYELTAPLSATLGQINSRELYARGVAASAFSSPVSADGRAVTLDGSPPSSLWFRISLFGQPGPEPPLGWTLAPETVDDMRQQLAAQANVAQIRQIRALLDPSRLSCQ